MVPREAETGFTLLEALIATAIGAFLIGAVMLAFQGTIRAQARIAASAAHFETVRTARNALDGLLEAAVRPPGFLARDYFKGTPARVSFLALLPGAGEAARVTIAAEGAPPNVRLRAEIAPLIDAEVSGEELLTGLSRATLQYYGTTDTYEAPTWRDDWSSPEMPRLVALDIEFADPAKKALRLEFAVPAEAPIWCDETDFTCLGQF